VCLKHVDISSVANNVPLVDEELVQSHDVPASDVETFRVLESPEKGLTYAKFMKPKALSSKDAVKVLNEDLKKQPVFGPKAHVADAGIKNKTK
jgi:hypothetical protein